MKTKKILSFLLLLAASSGLMATLQGCSSKSREKAEELTASAGETHSGQTEVNAIVALMDNYAGSIAQAQSLEEIYEMDSQFAENLSRFYSSQQPVTDADRTAVLAASSRLGKAAFDKLTSFGAAPEVDLAEQQRQMADLLSECTTVGQLARAGG